MIQNLSKTILRWGKKKLENKPYSASDVKIIDYKVIDELKNMDDGDRGFIGEIINLFLDEMPSMISGINIAHETKEYDKLAKASHRLKGACLNLGAEALAKTCSEIEVTSRIKSSDRLDLLMDEFRHYSYRTENELKNYLNTILVKTGL